MNKNSGMEGWAWVYIFCADKKKIVAKCVQLVFDSAGDLLSLFGVDRIAQWDTSMWTTKHKLTSQNVQSKKERKPISTSSARQ